jgi:hypothetical protein
MRAEAGFSRRLGFRLFQQYRSTPAVHGVGAKRQIYPATASPDFVLSLRQQLVRIDADGASDGDVFRRVMAGIEQGPHASLDAALAEIDPVQSASRELFPAASECAARETRIM